MLQLVTEILGEKIILDLFGNEDIFMSMSIAEIQDISKKNSSYTKDFNLPGSKINNQVFQHFYNVNSVQTNYDARNKFSAYFTYDGYTIMTGYIRLNSVTQTRTEIFYNVNFYNQIGDVSSNISDKYMRDLDLSYLSHPYTRSLGYDSIPDPDLANSSYIPQPTSGITYWSLFNKGYQYQTTTGGTLEASIEPTMTPLLNFFPQGLLSAGTFSNEYSPVRYFYFTPTIKINELYKQVFSQSGYEIDSNFFDTAYFNRFHLPLSFSDTLYPLQSYQPEFGFSSDTPTLSGRTQYFCQTQDCSVVTAGSPPQDFILRPSTIFVDNFSADTGTNYSFELSEIGLYHFRCSFTAVNTGLTDASVVMYIMRQYQSPTSFTGLSMGNQAYLIPAGTTGDSVTFDFRINTANRGITLTDYYSVNTFFSNTGPAVWISGLTFQLIPEENNPLYISGDFQYNLEFPENEFKQIDFIQSVNKMFNLVVVPNNEFPNRIVVEPMIDYFHSGDVLDWTGKVDRNQPIVVQPTTSIIQGTISYLFPDEEDTGNVNFRELNNRNFGTQNISLTTDYKDSITEIEPIFTSLVDYQIPNPGSTYFPTLPIHYLTVQKDVEGVSTNFFNPYKTNPQLYYRGLMIPSTNLGLWSGTPSDVVWRVEDPSGLTPSIVVKSFPNNNRFTTYPFGVSGFSHYINFNKTDFYDVREKQFCGSDMYDIYWKDYILDLTDDESRLVTLSVYLTPFEIQQLNFSELILIDGNYYRLNKITDYSLTRQGVVKVELVKKTRDYTSHPVRYFDLNSCTGSTVIHTSTDYNATLYAYVGNYIKVGGECFQIVNSTYNSSYTYERVNNDYYYSQDTFQPVVFDTCSDCTGATSSVYYTVSTPLDIYDELPC